MVPSHDPKERTDDLLFAAARAPSLNVVKAQNGATCATTQGEGLVVVTIVNESDQYKTAAVVCYCKSAQARSVDGVLENVKDRADAYYERLKALTPKPDPRAPPQRGPRFPAKWKAFVATADLPPRSRRVALAVVRSGSQYELGDIDCAFYDAAPPAKKGQQRIDAFVGASKSRTALDADGLFAAVALPERLHPRSGGAVPVAADDDLEEALRQSRGDDAVDHDDLEDLAEAIGRGGPAIATTTSRKRCAGRARTRRRGIRTRSSPRRSGGRARTWRAPASGRGQDGPRPPDRPRRQPGGCRADRPRRGSTVR